MRLAKAAALATAAVVLAGCASHAARKATGSPAGSHSGVASTVASPTTPSETNPIAAAIATGQYPACRLTVGLPTSEVVRDYNASTKQVDLRCVTGTSSDSDKTGAGMTNCNPIDPASSPIYYWASQKAGNADQNVYAAKTGSVVVIVPSVTADGFFSTPGGIGAVIEAAGSC